MSISQQVRHYMLKSSRVALHGQQFGQVGFQHLFLLLDHRVHRRQRVGNDGSKVERLAIKLEGARLELIQGEEVVDEDAKTLDAAARVSQQFPLLGPQLLHSACLEHAQPRAGRGERRAQLVGDRRDEVCPEPVQFLQPLSLTTDQLGGLLLQRQPSRQDRHADPEHHEQDQPSTYLSQILGSQRPPSERQVDGRHDDRDNRRVDQARAK